MQHVQLAVVALAALRTEASRQAGIYVRWIPWVALDALEMLAGFRNAFTEQAFGRVF